MVVYYAIAVIANVIAAFIFREYWNFTIVSILPILTIYSLAHLAFYQPSKRRVPGERFDPFSTTVYGILLPFPSICILFFANWVKASIMFTILVGNSVVNIYCHTVLYKERNEYRATVQKELRNQEQKEELGKFK